MVCGCGWEDVQDSTTKGQARVAEYYQRHRIKCGVSRTRIDGYGYPPKDKDLSD